MVFRSMRSMGVALLIVGASGLTPPVPAAFQPGHIYVTATYITGFTAPGRIFEVNPATGQARIFAEFEPQSSPNSLAFTPDGRYLRVVHRGQVLNIDGDGQVAGTAYGPADGVFPSGSANAMGYDAAGNFYVQSDARILRMPGDAPPIEIFADSSDGIGGSGPIGISPRGEGWYLDHSTIGRLLYFNERGESTLIDDFFLTGLRPSLAVDRNGDCYILRSSDATGPGGIFRYRRGKVSEGERIVRGDRLGGTLTSMSISPIDGMLYFAGGSIIARINPESGSLHTVGEITVGLGSYPSRGIAIYVPEPASCLVALAWMCFLRPQRIDLGASR